MFSRVSDKSRPSWSVKKAEKIRSCNLTDLIENIINQDPHVQSAVMFGRGEFNAGILVDPAPGCAFDPSDPAKLEKFRNDIWLALLLVRTFETHTVTPGQQWKGSMSSPLSTPAYSKR